MIKEAIDKIEGMSSRYTKIDTESIRNKIIFLQPDGSYKEKDDDATRRSIKVDSLYSFVAAVEHYRAIDRFSAHAAAIFVDANRVVCHLDDSGDARYSIGFSLVQADWFERFLVNAHPWVSQADLLRLLRTTLVDAVQPPLVPLVRAVEWRAKSESRAANDRGAESLGRSVERAVSTVDKLPEFVDVTIKPWKNLMITSDARCVLEIDVNGEKFRLTPIGDTECLAMERCLEILKGSIEEKIEDVPVFLG